MTNPLLHFAVPMFSLLPLLTQINSATEIRLSMAEVWGIATAIGVGIPSLIAIVRQFERTRIRFVAQEEKIIQLTALVEKQAQDIAVLTKQVETLVRTFRQVTSRKRRAKNPQDNA
ncbi:hypothetical protein ACFPMF_01725 [Larkinella bovis]|uniref:Uncharacterized protein n=1 Tax=Larkinella bovis TaxID=683041 RepID=A0ABW0I3B9_9BACT